MRKSLLPTSIATGFVLISAFAAPAQSAAPVYASPQVALETLVAAMESGDVRAALDAIDPAAGDLAQSDDPAEQVATLRDLLAQYRMGYRFVPTATDEVMIELGADGWPFPVPLVKVAGGWAFDTEAGRSEILNREIGGNELAVIAILQAYVGIQATYRTVDHDGDGVREFAAAIISSDGTKDGLFWPGGDSPVGDIAARASLDGYADAAGDQPAEPLFGYFFPVLTKQGSAAPGGAFSYLVNGNMLAGHAALAVPAVYGETGIHSFLVSEAGVVLQADLGEATAEVGFAIESFEPRDGWAPAK